MGTRFIEPGKKLVKEFVYTPQIYPTSLPVLQYVRQSSDEQVRNNKQSLVMQERDLEKRLIAYGWKSEGAISKIDDDQGVSGQARPGTGPDERKGLYCLKQMMKQGKVAAVAAYAPSRFIS